MSKGKLPILLFGAVAGMAAGAALIGLLLVGIAIAVGLQADGASAITEHPLYVSGSQLVTGSLTAGLPLYAVWCVWRGRS